ncbi:hypothetical protein K8P10_001119 [Leucobacter sp. Psy1]|nr:hypothetical protein K8P10_001119 [Leucobacter sp. Psy1]
MLRGTLVAVASTLLAAGSHALGGSEVTTLSVVATAALAWPVCIALSGRAGSLLRTSVAVVASQFLFHWSFAGLGAAHGPVTTAGTGISAHAAHSVRFGTLQGAEAPLSSVSLGEASLLMWISHALAAAATVALISRGEAGARSVRGLLRRIVLPPAPAIVAHRHRAGILAARDRYSALRPRLCSLSAISHRGPPGVLVL